MNQRISLQTSYQHHMRSHTHLPLSIQPYSSPSPLMSYNEIVCFHYLSPKSLTGNAFRKMLLNMSTFRQAIPHISFHLHGKLKLVLILQKFKLWCKITTCINWNILRLIKKKKKKSTKSSMEEEGENKEEGQCHFWMKKIFFFALLRMMLALLFLDVDEWKSERSYIWVFIQKYLIKSSIWNEYGECELYVWEVFWFL